MKKILLILILLTFWSLSVLAQSPPPPPPPPAPLIYAAPSNAEIIEYTSKENKFKASFPGNPKVEVKNSGENVVNIFRVYREGSNSIITVTEFKNDVGKNKDEILKQYKENIANIALPFKGATMTSPKIIEENEIKVGKYKGVELKYEANLGFGVLRILFVNKRIYELKTDVTNWHILIKHRPEIVKSFQKETDRFFNSFQLL